MGFHSKALIPKVCSIKKPKLGLSGVRVISKGVYAKSLLHQKTTVGFKWVISKGVCAKSLHEQQKKAVWEIVGLGCVTSIDVDSNGVLHQQKKRSW